MSDMYDAYGHIELPMRHLSQQNGRGQYCGCDADIFRCGDPQDLRPFLNEFANTLNKRVNSVLTTDEQRKTLKMAIDGIRAVQSRISQQEHEDYHWLIIGHI